MCKLENSKSEVKEDAEKMLAHPKLTNSACNFIFHPTITDCHHLQLRRKLIEFNKVPSLEGRISNITLYSPHPNYKPVNFCDRTKLAFHRDEEE